MESSKSNGKGVKSQKAKATEKSPRAAVKSLKAKAAETAKPVCQGICILPVSPLLQGILYVLRVPLIKPLIVVVATSPTHIVCQLNHRALWKVQWRICCGNSSRVMAVSGCPPLLRGAKFSFRPDSKQVIHNIIYFAETKQQS